MLENRAAQAGRRGLIVRGPLQSRFQSPFALCCMVLDSGRLEALLKVRPTQSTCVLPMVATAAAAAPSVARSELRAECAKFKLSQHGLKAALARRLLDHYEALDRATLREACVRWSLSLRGSKAEALQRLESKLGALAASAAGFQQEGEEGGESEADPDWTDDPPLQSPEAEPSSLASSPDVSAQVTTSRRVRRKTAHYSPGGSDGSGPADDDPWDWKGIEVDSE